MYLKQLFAQAAFQQWTPACEHPSVPKTGRKYELSGRGKPGLVAPAVLVSKV